MMIWILQELNLIKSGLDGSIKELFMVVLSDKSKKGVHSHQYSAYRNNTRLTPFFLS